MVGPIVFREESSCNDVTRSFFRYFPSLVSLRSLKTFHCFDKDERNSSDSATVSKDKVFADEIFTDNCLLKDIVLAKLFILVN